MDRIVKGIQKFQKDVFPASRDLFQRLAGSQSPEVFFVACSDSRVALEWITQCRPGDLFVSRNAGNFAPSYSPADSNSGTIEYAVAVLKVKHIVVCGHSDCGAMKGLLQPDKISHLPNVKSWLRHGEGALRALESSGIPLDSPEALPAVTRLNVRLQLENLRTHPAVFSALRAGAIQLHGWVYRIDTGEVHAWDGDDRWVTVQEAAQSKEALYA